MPASRGACKAAGVDIGADALPDADPRADRRRAGRGSTTRHHAGVLVAARPGGGAVHPHRRRRGARQFLAFLSRLLGPGLPFVVGGDAPLRPFRRGAEGGRASTPSSRNSRSVRCRSSGSATSSAARRGSPGSTSRTGWSRGSRPMPAPPTRCRSSPSRSAASTTSSAPTGTSGSSNTRASATPRPACRRSRRWSATPPRDVIAEAKPTPAELAALREAFVPGMVRINDEGGFVRQAARWDEVPEESRRLLSALAGPSARLLVIRDHEGTREVEVAHEALFRVWPLLAGWLEEEREFLIGRNRLERALADWQALPEGERDKGLIAGILLERAQELAERSIRAVSTRPRAGLHRGLGPGRGRAASARPRSSARRSRRPGSARPRPSATPPSASSGGPGSRPSSSASSRWSRSAPASSPSGPSSAPRAEADRANAEADARQCRSRAGQRRGGPGQRQPHASPATPSTTSPATWRRASATSQGMRIENLRAILQRVETAIAELLKAAPDDEQVLRGRATTLTLFSDTYLAAGDTGGGAGRARRGARHPPPTARGPSRRPQAPERPVADPQPPRRHRGPHRRPAGGTGGLPGGARRRSRQCWRRSRTIADAQADVWIVADQGRRRAGLDRPGGRGGLALYEEGLAIVRELAAADPDNDEWLRRVGQTLSAIGDTKRRTGDQDGRDGRLRGEPRAGPRARRTRPDQCPLPARPRRSRSSGSATRSCSPATTTRRWRCSTRRWPSCATLRRAIPATRATSPISPSPSRRRPTRRSPAATSRRRSKLYEEQLAIARALAAADPDNTDWQRGLSVALERIGDAKVKAGDSAGALAVFEESLAINRRLAESDPDQPRLAARPDGHPQPGRRDAAPDRRLRQLGRRLSRKGWRSARALVAAEPDSVERQSRPDHVDRADPDHGARQGHAEARMIEEALASWTSCRRRASCPSR